MIFRACSPAIGLGQHLWTRHRTGLSLLTGYLLLLVFLAHAPAARVASSTVFMSAIPFGLGILYLMAVFTHSEADVAAADSGYPGYLLTLPVPTRSLVIWPMLYGVLAVSAAWIALVCLVILPRGGTVAIAWPAAMLAAITAWLQAIFWLPLRLRYLRLFLVLIVLPVLIILTILGVQQGLPSRCLTGLCIASILPAYALALTGVSRARHGGRERPSRIPVARTEPSVPLRSLLRVPLAKPFASAARAQFWFEWRQNGLLLPLLVGGVCLLFSIPLLWIRELTPLYDFQTGRQSPPEINLYIKIYLLYFWLLPPFLGGVIGCGLRKPELRRGEQALPLFIVTRPLPDAKLVVTKLKTAAVSVICAWAILFMFAAAWLLLPCRVEGQQTPLLLLLMKYGTLKSAFAVLLALVCLAGWTWRNQVSGLFAGFSGSTFLQIGYPVVLYIPLLIALIVIVDWRSNPAQAPSIQAVSAFMAWMLGSLAALKALLTVAAFRALHRKGLANVLSLANAAFAWLLVFAGLWGISHWFLQERMFPIELPSSLRSEGCLIAFAVLCVPIARLSLAVLMASRSRHR